jgi:hypothetical protein
MAQVTVFVDDVVQGRLPALCVKEGIPTTDRLTVRESVGGSRLGFAWLLLLLGPLGWICLLIIAVVLPSTRFVTGRLPFSEFAYRRLVVARRMERIWIGAFVATGALAFVVLVLSSGSPAMDATVVVLAGAAVGSLVKVGMEVRRVRLALVQLELDGSGRWVTIHGVHPDFATAAATQSASRQAGLSDATG